MIEILHFPAQPHFFSFGGFDIQMNRVIENLNNYDVKSTKVDLWNINQKLDIAHFWGTSNSHFSNIELCKKNSIPTESFGNFHSFSINLILATFK